MAEVVPMPKDALDDLTRQLGSYMDNARYAGKFRKSIKKGVIDGNEREAYLSYAKNMYQEQFALAKKLDIIDYLPLLICNKQWQASARVLQFIRGGVNAEAYINSELEEFAKSEGRTTPKKLHFNDIEQLREDITERIAVFYKRIGDSFGTSQVEREEKINSTFDPVLEKYALRSALTSRGPVQPIENLLLEIVTPRGRGNGILLTENGYVLTALHIVEDVNIKNTYTKDAQGNTFPCTEIAETSGPYDLAILRIERGGDALPTKISAVESNYDVGTEIETLHLYKGQIYRQLGVITADVNGYNPNQFCTSVSARGGFSGSACLRNNALVGILKCRAENGSLPFNNNNVHYAAFSKLNPIKEFLESILDSE